MAFPSVRDAAHSMIYEQWASLRPMLFGEVKDGSEREKSARGGRTVSRLSPCSSYPPARHRCHTHRLTRLLMGDDMLFSTVLALLLPLQLYPFIFRPYSVHPTHTNIPP